jgi:glycine/D-amino acid oxidase-like deaminating enzyme
MSEIHFSGVFAMSKIFDILIIGAGIVGTACACELASAGLSVCILEREAVGSGATAAGMGHIVVMDDSPAQLTLTRYSQTLWEKLVQEPPATHDYTRCGTIWIACDASEMQMLQTKEVLFHAHAIPCQVLSPAQLYQLEPQLRPGLAGGLLVSDDSVVYPPSSAAFLLSQAEQQGAIFRTGLVVRLLPGQTGVELADGERIASGAVVLANGACAPELLPDLPVRPKKGHLAITDRYPGFVRHQLVEVGYIKNAHAAHGDSVSFNVQPRATGQILIGSSRQFDETSRDIEYSMLSRMLDSALAYLPNLAQLNCLRCWTGIRAATPDGLPLIGPYSERPGIWLATGHEGLGITTAPATARLLAAQMLGRAMEIPIAPYLPQRFLQEAKYV